MKKSEVLTTAELADRWNLHKGSIRRWRTKGDGPKFIRVGHNIVYKLSVIVAYEKRNMLL